MRLFNILFLAVCTLFPMASQAFTMEELRQHLNHHEASYLTQPLIGQWQSTTPKCGGKKCVMTIKPYSSRKAEMIMTNGGRFCLEYTRNGVWEAQNITGTRVLSHFVLRGGKIYDDKNHVVFTRIK